MQKPTFKKTMLFLETQNKCSYCRCDFDFNGNKNGGYLGPRRPTTDHIVPISVIRKLNLNNKEINMYSKNTVICCNKCNNERGSIPILEFLKKNNFEIAFHVHEKIKKLREISIHDNVKQYLV